ncbi:hypothetical protein L3X38_002939 [Prunus dulcis]|uniref:Uncharacterized protein n=1 Tax=Prunus dulcis TaxID=3755 RepID=A0AAD4ZLE8_PRUDU|nr:hypothetical protein L3X38_002939 [Prunus dulcis]
MDTYSGYNQILMHEDDKAKTSFIIERGTYYSKNDECEVALQNLKTYLTSPLMLSKPVPGEDLFVYLAVSNSVVSSTPIREELGA